MIQNKEENKDYSEIVEFHHKGVIVTLEAVKAVNSLGEEYWIIRFYRNGDFHSLGCRGVISESAIDDCWKRAKQIAEEIL